MANHDSFISEVTEEVRRDKLFALFRRYGWIAILAIVLLVGGAAMFEWQKARARAEAEAAGDAVIAALSAAEPDARAEALDAIDAGDSAGRKAVVELARAGALAEAGDTEGARAALDALAADAGVPEIYRDLAALKSVIAGAATVSADERISRLQSLSMPGRPFRLLALEQRALAEVEKGDTTLALETLKGILADAEVTQDLRRRATQLIVALGGTVSGA